MPQNIETRRRIGLEIKRRQVGLFNPLRDKSAGGKTAAQIHKRRGTGVFDPRMGQFGLHVQHHVKKGVVNPRCEVCISGAETFAEFAEKEQKIS